MYWCENSLTILSLYNYSKSSQFFLVNNYSPRSTKLKGVYLFHLVPPSVRLSVCGQNRVRSASSRILTGSISCLYMLSSNLRSCVACKVFFLFQNVLDFGKLFILVTLTLSSFDLGSNVDWSVVWLIIGRWGYSQNAGVLVVLVHCGLVT